MKTAFVWMILSSWTVVLGTQSVAMAKSSEKVYVETKTKEGLTLVVLPMNKVPLVTIVLVAKAGAMTETSELNGLTHLWEHMFFKGNKRLPDQEAFNRRIRQLGISYNGDTSAEMVRYYFTLPSKYLAEGLEFMSDAISTPLLEQKELERERKVVLDEYDRNASQPGFELNNIERMLIYGDQEHLRNPLGRRSKIEKTTREQLLRIKDEVFVPANSAVIVAGDVVAADVQKLVDRYFEGWKTPKSWKPVDRGPFPAFPATTDVITTHPMAQNVNFQITWQGPTVAHNAKDTFVADVLSQLVEHRSGNFYRKFIDSGLTLNSGVGYHTQSKVGELVAFGMTAPENFKKAKQEILAEVSLWAKPGYFSNVQLEDVRRRMRISRKMELNKPSEFGKTLAFWWAIAGLDYYDHYLDQLDKVQLSDVQKFVQTYMIGRPHVDVALLSPKDLKKSGVEDNSKPLAEKYLKNY